MRRLTLAGLLMLWLLLLALTAFADMDYRLQPRQIAEGTYLLEGSTENFARSNGGNIVNTGFIITDSGVVVIDTGPSRRYGEALRRAIATVTDKPVIQVLLTHHHPDHVLGNQAFADVPIGALAGTTAQMRAHGDALAENLYRMVGDWMRGTETVLPTQVLQSGVREIGGHPLRLLALAGHTGSDLAILDERTGVLFAGDLLFYQRALTTPDSPGLQVWLGDLERLQALPWKLLVPGHGPLASEASPFEQTRDYLTWLDALLREGAEQGQDMTELIVSPIPDRFGSISLTRYELIRSVSHLYPAYERVRMARVDGR